MLFRSKNPLTRNSSLADQAKKELLLKSNDDLASSKCYDIDSRIGNMGSLDNLLENQSKIQKHSSCVRDGWPADSSQIASCASSLYSSFPIAG